MSVLIDRLQGALAGRYRIERELGRGGMATVYLAQDLKHRPSGRASRCCTPSSPRRGRRAVPPRDRDRRAASTIPTSSRSIDSGSADGLLYYVMPFVEGESLRDRLDRERPLPIDEAVRITAEVAEALAYAHAQGVVHRDIKPENILLHEGEAMVADFGIAKALSARAARRLTQTGHVARHAGLHEPGAGIGRARDRRPERHLLAWAACCTRCWRASRRSPGPTAQAVIVKRFTEPVPPVRALRARRRRRRSSARSLRALARSPGRALRHRLAVRRRRSSAARSRTPPDGAATLVTASHRAASSIAVLPFADMSPPKDQEYFCDGIAEEIINALTKIDALQRGLAHLGVRVQGQEPGHPPGGRAAQGGDGARGQRAQGRQPAPHHRAAHQRRRRLSPLVRALRPRAGGRVRDAGRDRGEHRAARCGWCSREDEKRGHRAAPHRRTSRRTSTTSAAGSSSTSSGEKGLQFARRMFEPGHRDRSQLRPRLRRHRRLQLAALQVLGRQRGQPGAGGRRQPQGAGARPRTWRRRTPRAGSR